MQTAKQIALISLFTAWAILGIVAAFVAFVDGRRVVQEWATVPARVTQVQSAVERVPGEIVSQVLPVIDKHAGLIRRDAFGAIEKLEVRVLDPEKGQFTALLRDVLQRVDEGVGIIRDLRTSDVGPTLAAASASITEIRDNIRPTLSNLASITAHADEASAVLFRRDALPAQLLGLTAAGKVTLGETTQTMKVFRAAAPMFVSQGQAITNEFLQIGTNINRLTKPHWYDRLLGYTVNGAVLYRQLNPATNLTIKAAEIVSSRP